MHYWNAMHHHAVRGVANAHSRGKQKR